MTLNRNANNTVAKRIVPGNESYSNMTRHTKKLCSDSISKRIDMVKFNKEIDKGTAINDASLGLLHPNLKVILNRRLKMTNPTS